MPLPPTAPTNMAGHPLWRCSACPVVPWTFGQSPVQRLCQSPGGVPHWQLGAPEQWRAGGGVCAVRKQSFDPTKWCAFTTPRATSFSARPRRPIYPASPICGFCSAKTPTTGVLPRPGQNLASRRSARNRRPAPSWNKTQKRSLPAARSALHRGFPRLPRYPATQRLRP